MKRIVTEGLTAGEALAWWSIVVANGLALAVMLSSLGGRHRQAWQGFHAVGLL